MYTNIQQNFRYYLALILTVILAVGVRLQAAPLGTHVAATVEVIASKPVGNQVSSAPGAVATR
ncbi:MAG: hypothetical protein JWR44_720 [Hymenobacter sp.]|jgi:hypothetical protein|nr:hypothetical protein [Hymenobacter sp.]